MSRTLRTHAGSTVWLIGQRGASVAIELDWFEEEHACFDCEVDIDATMANGFTRLVWRCEVCGGGEAALRNVSENGREQTQQIQRQGGPERETTRRQNALKEAQCCKP